MITDTATPAPPTPTRPAAPPNAQVRTPSIDYATALRTDQTAQVIIAGHAFMQNLRRGLYEIALDIAGPERVAVAFTELALAV